MCENIVEKGENTGDQHFLFIPDCFHLFRKKFQNCAASSLSSANAFNSNFFFFVRKQLIVSITCIKRPFKGSNESGLIQQVVFKYRFY